MSSSFNPVSSYRIQFNSEFTFSHFQKIIPYLQKLGVRTIYASPIFEATPGSTHGYDGINPNKINPEIGTLEQLLSISAKLKERDMSWIQDIVPNHMSFHENNQWLMDVLAHGQESEYARVFDIIWDHHYYPDRLMVPFPGSTLENELKEKIPDEKNYVLCSWQETDYRMNYRRFFLVNTLICTNIHYEDVFDKYHALVKELVERGVFQGLRIDHVDGLYDPSKYLNDLRKLAGAQSYIIVEKILEHREQMPEYWPVQGNSGYDFLGYINNLFTNRSSEYSLTSLYYDITGDGTPVDQQIHEKKSIILNRYMKGELDNLVRLYRTESASSPEEISDEALEKQIEEYLVKCPVYRYYDDIPPMKTDDQKDRNRLKKFYQRCMQFTGPLMAKGVEDTLMYTYNRFIGHNEVGDSPEFFGYTVQEFHELMEARISRWPYSLNASSTHDTKRGEDVRARLNALTDLHEEWIELVKKWQKINKGKRTGKGPDGNDEYLIYQTIVGSYPMMSSDGSTREEIRLYSKRLQEYLQKAMREAKVHSTWTEPDSEYEASTIAFALELLQEDGEFFRSFLPFFQKVCYYGIINSFGQLALKFCCPGIPDVYQGTELWDLSLVDPDNRRAVDYELRMRMIKNGITLPELWNSKSDGRIKLKLLHQLQKLRNRYNDVFNEGEYIPLNVEGTFREHAIAFMRKNRHVAIVTIVPLHLATVHRYDQSTTEIPLLDWKETKVVLPMVENTTWTDLLNSGEKTYEHEIMLNEALATFPIAIIKS